MMSFKNILKTDIFQKLHLSTKKSITIKMPFDFIPFITASLLTVNKKTIILKHNFNKKLSIEIKNEINSYMKVFNKNYSIYNLFEDNEDLLLSIINKISFDFSPFALICDENILQNTFIPDVNELKNKAIYIHIKEIIPISGLIKKLHKYGYERVRYTENKGEFSQRGGIVDVFPKNLEYPVRIEFFGDQIESIRPFSPIDQGSSNIQLKKTVIFPLKAKQTDQALLKYIKTKSILVTTNETDLKKNFQNSICIIPPHSPKNADIKLDIYALNTIMKYDITKSIEFNINKFIKDKAQNATIFLTAEDDYSLKELEELFKDKIQKYSVFLSEIEKGFHWKNKNLILFTHSDVFKKTKTPKSVSATKKFFEKIAETLKPGDLVVHSQYGIGKYIGTAKPKSNIDSEEYMLIEYANKAKLYVPKEQFFMVQKYIGIQKTAPPLDNLHSKKWANKKKKAQEDIYSYAVELLKLEAQRKTLKGYSFIENKDWVKEFENAFIYEDTPDQKKATIEIYEDMEKEKPMDRIILGDVGYGKTEVAARAAFKAAVCGKQTAILVPTTILANQHLNTLKERMKNFPVTIEAISRFQTTKKQKETIKKIRNGEIDIIIGTHRILQNDIEFKDLGLLIIDEEQKFGVKQKNHIKKLYPQIDILTLSATPIPRTLYLSLMGAIDISLIQTPPSNRKPIKTIITHTNTETIKKAIEKELNRKGQVFIIHNRVKTIKNFADKIHQIIPKAKISIAHGQMEKHKLKKIMADFYLGKIDILISTIIIQSGIDISNVNTMIIHNADMFGLSDLYQLKGRIGRGENEAYCYFLIDKKKINDPEIQERIQAIKEFSSPGGNFNVALKDLEIRGAGNIVGTKQSGHITAIGFDLYCKLLDDTMKLIKGEKIIHLYDVKLDIGINFFIPTDYIDDFQERFNYYKRLFSANSETEIQSTVKEIKDRFGHLPLELRKLIQSAKIKLSARKKLIDKIQLKKNYIYLYRNNNIIQKIPVNEKIKKNHSELLSLIKNYLDGLN